MRPELPTPMYTVSVSYRGGRAGKIPAVRTGGLKPVDPRGSQPVWKPMIRLSKPKPADGGAVAK